VKSPAFKRIALFSRSSHRMRAGAEFWTAAVLLALFPGFSLGQAASPTQTNPGQTNPAQTNPAAQVSPAAGTAVAGGQANPPAASPDKSAKTEKLPRGGERRRASKLFLEASKLFEKEQFEAALDRYKQASMLDPTNRDYALAAELTRSHAVTALVQTAEKDRIRGDAAAERTALQQALALDPHNIQVTEHLREMGDDALTGDTPAIYEQSSEALGAPISAIPTLGAHSFHLHTDQRRAIQEVFKAYGLEATVDDSVRLTQVRLDIDDASFDEAMRAVGLVTNTFYVPLDTHRMLVARDTTENRKQFDRLDLETIYLPGLNAAEIAEVGTLAKTVFEMTAAQASVDASAGTITVRAQADTMNAFNATIRDIIDGHSEVLLEVTLIQLAHTSDRNTGIQPPQSMSLYNVDAEVQSLISQNQALIQQIISSGLAAPGDTLAILGILLASGQVTSPLFSNGSVEIGGNCPLTVGATCKPSVFALAPGSTSLNFALNSSDSRELDHMLLRLSDGGGASDTAAGTIKSGTRYPIQTSSFSSLSASLPNIPGLTGAGTSGTLASLLGSLGGSVPNVPQVEYQDLGLTLKATPKVMRNDDVALTIDMKIDALSGSSINGNPILNNRAYSGIVTLKQGEGVVIVSELDKQESRAISGIPGLSEVPGLNDITDKDVERNGATLLIVMTPHVIRGTQAAGHTPMMRVEHGGAAAH
jgi:general secretion pathway protein D